MRLYIKYSCIFRISKNKKGTARSYFHLNNNLVNCFTIETSNSSYLKFSENKIEEFNIDSWLELGEEISNALYNLVKLEVDQEKHHKLLCL